MVVLNPTNNLPNFDFRGKNSLTDMKVYMTSKPSIPSPELRANYVTVDGRDSTYTVTDGTYDDIEISFGLRAYRGIQTYQDSLNKLNSWLRLSYLIDENEIVFSEYPSWVFKVKGVHPYTWEHYPVTGEITTMITLRCEPFKFSYRDNVVMGTGGATNVPPRSFPLVWNDKLFRVRPEPNLRDRDALSQFSRRTDMLLLRGSSAYHVNSLRSVDGQSLASWQMKGNSSVPNIAGFIYNEMPDFYQLPFQSFRVDPNQSENESYSSYAVNSTEWRFNGKGMIHETQQTFWLDPGVYYNISYETAGTNNNYLILEILDKTTGSTYGFGGAHWNGHSNFVLQNGNHPDTKHEIALRVRFRSDVLPDPGFGKAHDITLKDIMLSEGYEASPPSFHPIETTVAGHQVAINLAEIARNFEPNIFSGVTTETDLRARLSQRNFSIKLDFVSRYSGVNVTRKVCYRMKDLSWTEVSSMPAFNGADQEYSVTLGKPAVDNATYTVDAGVPNLWLVILMYTDKDYDNPQQDFMQRLNYFEMLFPTVTMTAIPQSSREIVNEESFTCFPLMKVYPTSGASNAKITFEGLDFMGRPYKQIIALYNLTQITGQQYLEIDCEYKDVNRVDPTNSANTRQWNQFSEVDKFPVMQSGTNKITIENIQKMEFTWRTRKL